MTIQVVCDISGTIANPDNADAYKQWQKEVYSVVNGKKFKVTVRLDSAENADGTQSFEHICPASAKTITKTILQGVLG